MKRARNMPYIAEKRFLDSNEEIILDANELSKGHDYFSLGRRVISPNNEWLAYTIDTVGQNHVLSLL